MRVTNIGTNISNEVTTGAEGGYAVARLIPGQYRIEVSYAGFKTAASPALTLLVNQNLRFDAVLEPGTVETVVEVTAVGTLIETDTSSVGKVVENKQIVDLPMVSRNFTDLIVLSPATVTDNQGALANEQSIFRTGISGGGSFIGGGRAGDNAYMIDGVENNDPGFQTPSITPPIDAIQEFRLMNKNYSAEFGGGAAQINIAIKSGTNEIHGTAYEFLRNDVLNARNFFAEEDPATGRSKPQLRYNQFGASIGGPIARNRLFYFFNYEGTRVRTFAQQSARYPTSAQLNGDFSGELPVTDYLTGEQFPNNQIPSNRISAKSRDLLFLFPRAERASTHGLQHRQDTCHSRKRDPVSWPHRLARQPEGQPFHPGILQRSGHPEPGLAAARRDHHATEGPEHRAGLDTRYSRLSG